MVKNKLLIVALGALLVCPGMKAFGPKDAGLLAGGVVAGAGSLVFGGVAAVTGFIMVDYAIDFIKHFPTEKWYRQDCITEGAPTVVVGGIAAIVLGWVAVKCFKALSRTLPKL